MAAGASVSRARSTASRGKRGPVRGWPDRSGSPSALGQYSVALQFQENGSTGAGAYRVDADGKLSLTARTGMTTPLGTLTRITPAYWGSSGSDGIGINQQGQVVLTAQIDNGPDVLLLLTPKSPAGNPSL